MRTVRAADPGLTCVLPLIYLVTLLGCDPSMTVDMPSDDAFVGTPGDPIADLSEADSASFAAGKVVFESTYDPDDGLSSPAFSTRCSGCHDQPATGGSGGLVNFAVAGEGANGATFITVRAANALFGLGLLASVSDDEILSRQDPTDTDGDGISGRPNLENDRVGRLGHKAQAATIESMVRGMLFNQMGLTSAAIDEAAADTNSPAQRALAQAGPPTAGNSVDGDSDEVPDPEVSADEVAALVGFIQNLAAPTRGDTSDAIGRGETLFGVTGCSGCHVPALTTVNGETIHPYTDLLLHDMGDNMDDSIETGVALGTEFRTQPLWGLRYLSVFLHNASADTLDEAIAAHGGEAEAARQAFDALKPDDQQDLLAFLNSL